MNNENPGEETAATFQAFMDEQHPETAQSDDEPVPVQGDRFATFADLAEGMVVRFDDRLWAVTRVARDRGMVTVVVVSDNTESQYTGLDETGVVIVEPVPVDKLSALEDQPKAVQDVVAGLVGDDPHRTFVHSLRYAVNLHSMENTSNTPDFILAELLEDVLDVFSVAIRHRDQWYDIAPAPGWDRGHGHPIEPADVSVAIVRPTVAELTDDDAQIRALPDDVQWLIGKVGEYITLMNEPNTWKAPFDEAKMVEYTGRSERAFIAMEDALQVVHGRG